MRTMTVLGTRPEIIRLSQVIPLLDRYSDHLLVHTGQNFDDRLNGLFFRELNVRKPDFVLDVKAETAGAQISQILSRIEPLLIQHRPDRLLLLGDTNSGLTAIVARRMGIPVYHMEAGNRCYDFRVPEEANRRVIDHMSTVLMPYTHRSHDNLLREGFARESIYVTGNPIKEVMDHYAGAIAASQALDALGLTRGKYFLVTMHRAENVDVEVRLRSLVEGLQRIHAEYQYPVICSLHPRTRAMVEAFGINLAHAGLSFVEPLGFFDFIHLEQSAFCLLTDSGTVQEEACILHVPNVTVRDVTERPETIECGSNVLAGADPDVMVRLVKLVTGRPAQWQAPPEYLMTNVAATSCRIVLGLSAAGDGLPANC
ncbi:MAG: UDP-N-acetylglucosamine 2-epimerase (non-hydrolyzing) [Acidobacteriia bacterium]|nr:UDP-N-acetylglucosamine 2-epimerase (non-hydrolyzing) [Terriglobia bacterium]